MDAVNDTEYNFIINECEAKNLIKFATEDTSLDLVTYLINVVYKINMYDFSTSEQQKRIKMFGRLYPYI